jgi:hypothetical protein
MGRKMGARALTLRQVDDIMGEVWRWRHAWRRHLDAGDNLEELVQCARISAWMIGESLKRRGKWRVGSPCYCAWWGYRKGWDAYRAEHNADQLGGMCRHALALVDESAVSS